MKADILQFISSPCDTRIAERQSIFFMIAWERTWENVFWKVFAFLCCKAFGTAVIRNWEIKRDKTNLISIIFVSSNTHFTGFNLDSAISYNTQQIVTYSSWVGKNFTLLFFFLTLSISILSHSNNSLFILRLKNTF